MREMPIHDWTRVHAGTFHHFHNGWLQHLAETLNQGHLPEDYYAMAEQRAGQIQPDVLTLHAGESSSEWNPSPEEGNLAVEVATVPPEVYLTMEMSDEEAYRLKQKTLVIRHVTDHRVVALLEIVSPSNKDREAHVSAFVEKVQSAIRREIHFVLLDPLPPGLYDPTGMHGRVWYDIGGNEYSPPEGKPLTLASYKAAELPVAYVEPTAVGEELTSMPLFLNPRWYVHLPLKETYEAAYHGVPKFWQRVIEGDEQA
jgi:hypothetical protein